MKKESHSKSRQQAEIAFGKAQSQFLAREREKAPVSARDEKTSRLREARLARESQERLNSPATSKDDDKR